jgi:hypothetical protein
VVRGQMTVFVKNEERKGGGAEILKKLCLSDGQKGFLLYFYKNIAISKGGVKKTATRNKQINE